MNFEWVEAVVAISSLPAMVLSMIASGRGMGHPLPLSVSSPSEFGSVSAIYFLLRYSPVIAHPPINLSEGTAENGPDGQLGGVEVTIQNENYLTPSLLLDYRDNLFPAKKWRYCSRDVLN